MRRECDGIGRPRRGLEDGPGGREEAAQMYVSTGVRESQAPYGLGLIQVYQKEEYPLEPHEISEVRRSPMLYA